MKIKTAIPIQLLTAQLLKLMGGVLVLFRALRELDPETILRQAQCGSLGLVQQSIFYAFPLVTLKNGVLLKRETSSKYKRLLAIKFQFW